MIELGVDHIGSVIVSETDWKIPEVKETLDTGPIQRCKKQLDSAV